MATTAGDARARETATPVHGHSYNNVGAMDEATQVLGNVGSDVSVTAHTFAHIQAKNQTKQVVGNMSKETFAMLMGK